MCGSPQPGWIGRGLDDVLNWGSAVNRFPQSGSTVERAQSEQKANERVTNMLSITTRVFLSGLGLILISLAVSGCATLDGKRDDETYKRPTKAEQQQEESSQDK